MKAKQVGERVSFFCPGCGIQHTVNVGAGGWTFNGSLERPTLGPSILIRSGHYMPEHDGGDCWCTYNDRNPEDQVPYKCFQCHSYVKDGSIEYLGDCSHSLAGRTVELPNIDESKERW